jgi:hypothetical protein
LGLTVEEAGRGDYAVLTVPRRGVTLETGNLSETVWHAQLDVV